MLNITLEYIKDVPWGRQYSFVYIAFCQQHKALSITLKIHKSARCHFTSSFPAEECRRWGAEYLYTILAYVHCKNNLMIVFNIRFPCEILLLVNCVAKTVEIIVKLLGLDIAIEIVCIEGLFHNTMLIMA